MAVDFSKFDEAVNSDELKKGFKAMAIDILERTIR